ncbi:hypothetical protein B0H16DRAFT_1569912, partial [Mycena metata]
MAKREIPILPGHRGTSTALTWRKGKEIRRRCVGVLECSARSCSLDLQCAPELRRVHLHRQLKKSCLCGEPLRLRECGQPFEFTENNFQLPILLNDPYNVSDDDSKISERDSLYNEPDHEESDQFNGAKPKEYEFQWLACTDGTVFNSANSDLPKLIQRMFH